MEKRRNKLKQTVLAGLLILVPLALTVFVLRELFLLLDGIFAPLVNRVLAAALDRPEIHVPGLGLLLTVIVVLLLGWLSRSRLIHAMEGIIRRIPVAKSIYGGTKGILEIISQDQTEAFKRVVMIEYPKTNIFAIAFVTSGARWGHLDERMDDLLLVFVPTTPNPTSGFLLLVPREETVELPISVEEGVRMVISGGILLPHPRLPEAGDGPRPTRLRPPVAPWGRPSVPEPAPEPPAEDAADTRPELEPSHEGA